MNPFRNPQVIEANYVFLAIVLLLALAGGIGGLLSSRPQPPAWVARLNTQVYSWWVMVMILLFAFWFDHIGATLLFLAVSFAALREFMTLVYRRRSDHNAIAACFYVLLPLQYYFVLTDWYGMFTALIPVYAFLILPIIAAFSGDTAGLFERTAKIQWGAMITIFCLSHVPAIMTLPIKGFENQNIMLMLFLIVVVEAGKGFQHWWQYVLRRQARPLLPALSPDLTTAGVAGGLLSGMLLAGCLYRLTPFSPFQAACIGLLACVMGLAGQLVMSGIKHSYGVNHWGRLSGGRGGMLDHVDGVCFAAPVFFHVVRYYWT